MLKYVINKALDEEVVDAVDQLVQMLTTDLPKNKETIMTFAQPLKQQGLEQDREEERYEIDLRLIKNNFY